MNKVASYKNSVIIETDKKVNLIYGLNGTGKSTLSDFLYNPSDPRFSNCSTEGHNSEDILVYNQQFIRDYFYESENLKGIFTLSKENKVAEEKVKAAEKEIEGLESKKTIKNEEKTKQETELDDKKKNSENRVWEIKTKYAGGDRVLEYCLENLKGQKEKLFNHILSIEKLEEKPLDTVEQLKKEVEAVQGSNAQKYALLPKIEFSENGIETSELFQKQIVGNENSTIAELIKELGNSDWVKKGLGFLSETISPDGDACPFCQQKTITSELKEKIESFFDESYEKDLNDIKELKNNYEDEINRINQKEVYVVNPFISENEDKFDNLFDGLITTLKRNIHLIDDKINAPSKIIALTDSSEMVDVLNNFITDINISITDHNDKIDNKETTLSNIKNKFWSIMRWDYDQTVSVYLKEKSSIEKNIKSIDDELENIDQKLLEQRKVAVEEQKKTINIEEAIGNINSGLTELGIDGFKIEKYKDELYQIKRSEECSETFKTLSEGEKMIISFLYFRELCKGKKSASSQANKKIIIIDDPISSLSHVYIFNVGQMIKNEFLNFSNVEQLFLLTHSLYFFYEMTDTNHERRKENQKLFRLLKNSTGTQLADLKYEEIQNDYHSYWYIIKDAQQPPALIANCMRNIIEYFFNFIERRDLNNVFQKPELQATRFQAFCRYVNRESHSLGQNIFDFKEFNYDDFKEAFGLVFIQSGYEEHYKKMMK
nr:AAA family ATPase [Spirochaeta isovalerica]